MKKLFIVVCLVVGVVTCGTASALAENIAGKLGITGRIGFLVPAVSDRNDFKLETDVGFVGGGGLIYGIDRHFAAEIDVTRSEFNTNLVSGPDRGDFGITDIGLGVQYRFDLQKPQWVPYVGGGLDILLTDYTTENGIHTNVDDTVGLYAKGGIDYFFMRQLAVTAEVKGVAAVEADIHGPGPISGHFDPSNFSSTFGIRYFFY
jgi:outer membrane protein